MTDVDLNFIDACNSWNRIWCMDKSRWCDEMKQRLMHISVPCLWEEKLIYWWTERSCFLMYLKRNNFLIQFICIVSQSCIQHTLKVSYEQNKQTAWTNMSQYFSQYNEFMQIYWCSKTASWAEQTTITMEERNGLKNCTHFNFTKPLLISSPSVYAESTTCMFSLQFENQSLLLEWLNSIWFVEFAFSSSLS